MSRRLARAANKEAIEVHKRLYAGGKRGAPRSPLLAKCGPC